MIVHNPNTRDPEIRFTARSTPVAELGFAVTRNTLIEGQRREEVLFVDVTLWSRLAEIAEQYLQKGSTVFVEGRLQPDTWVDKQSGQKRSRLPVTGENLQILSLQARNQPFGLYLTNKSRCPDHCDPEADPFHALAVEQSPKTHLQRIGQDSLFRDLSIFVLLKNRTIFNDLRSNVPHNIRQSSSYQIDSPSRRTLESVRNSLSVATQRNTLPFIFGATVPLKNRS